MRLVDWKMLQFDDCQSQRQRDIRPRLRRPVSPSIIQQKSHHDMIIKPESNPKKSPKCLGTRSSRRMLHPNANSSSP